MKIKVLAHLAMSKLFDSLSGWKIRKIHPSNERSVGSWLKGRMMIDSSSLQLSKGNGFMTEQCGGGCLSLREQEKAKGRSSHRAVL